MFLFVAERDLNPRLSLIKWDRLVNEPVRSSLILFVRCKGMLFSVGSTPITPLHGDDDLASGVVSQHVGHRVRRLAERVGLVDDHLDVSGFEECGEGI